MTFVMHAEPVSLDVFQETGLTAWDTTRSVYDPLVLRDPNDNYTPKPKLATAWNKVNDTTWRITLRPNVKFHNGETLKADDVVATWAHMKRLEKGLIAGYMGGLKDIKKVDDLNVEMILGEADPVFPIRLQYFNVAPASFVADENNPKGKAVGSGPYQLVEWQKGQYLLYKRFDNYWGTKPDLAEVKVVWRQEASVRASAIQAGEAHLGRIELQDVSRVPKSTEVTGTEGITIWLNSASKDLPANAPLKDVRLREALNIAIDRQALLKGVFEGHATSMNGQPSTPVIVGFNKSLTEVPYDPERAKKLIKDAGFEGLKLSIMTNVGRYPKDKELTETVAGYWRAAGINVNMMGVEYATWNMELRTAREGQPVKVDALVVYHSNELMDAASRTVIYGMCYGPGPGATGSFRYCNKDYDKIALQAYAAYDTAERVKLVGQAYDIMRKDWGIIGLMVPNLTWAMAKNVTYQPRADDFLFFQDIKLN